MASLHLFLLLGFSGTPLVNLENHDVFNPSFMLCSWGPNTLLSHVSGNCLVLFDPKWQVLHEFRLSGEGPGELQRPKVFGVFPDKAIILNQNRFLVFDNALKPTKENFPGLIGFNPLGYGVRRGEGFLLIGSVSSTYAVWESQVENGEWKTTASLFPKPPDQFMSKYSLNYQEGLLFVRESPLDNITPGGVGHKNPDRYHIDVHDISSQLKENVVQVLSHSVVGLDGFDDKVLLVDKCFKTGGQFYAYIVFVSMADMSSRNYYLDTYAENGDFIGRKPIASQWRYLPIQGSDRVVKLNSETMELFRFNPE